MHGAAVVYDLHLPQSGSLKAKRRTIRPVIDGLRVRYRVSVAEVGGHDLWQRCRIGVAVVGSTAGHVSDVLDEVDRFVWSHPDVEVVDVDTTWLEVGAGLTRLEPR